MIVRYSLELDLSHQVVPERSSFRVLGTKIEVKLAKRDAARWQQLEGDGRDPECLPAANAAAPASKVLFMDILQYVEFSLVLLKSMC